MGSKLRKWMAEIMERKRSKKRWKRFTACLSVLIAGITLYALLIPALTLENDVRELACSLEVHQHTEECYATDENGIQQLVCGNAD